MTDEIVNELKNINKTLKETNQTIKDLAGTIRDYLKGIEPVQLNISSNIIESAFGSPGVLLPATDNQPCQCPYPDLPCDECPNYRGLTNCSNDAKVYNPPISLCSKPVDFD